MSGQGRAVAVTPEKVKLILDTLRDAHVEVTKVTVEKPVGGMLGGNAAATDLLSDLNHATKSLDLWLSKQATALVQFGQAIDGAMKAIQNADDDSEATARVIQNAVEGLTQKFYNLTGRDTRVHAPVPAATPGPFGALGNIMQTLESEAQFDVGVDK